MLVPGVWLSALVIGARFATQYNPLAAVVSAIVAAALAGYPRAPRARWWLSATVLALGWLAGDGLRVLAHARDLADGVGGGAWAGLGPAAWFALIIWALGTLALGYVAPALVGARVGRGVTHGTGWLAAATVAGALSAALSTISGMTV